MVVHYLFKVIDKNHEKYGQLFGVETIRRYDDYGPEQAKFRAINAAYDYFPGDVFTCLGEFDCPDPEAEPFDFYW